MTGATDLDQTAQPDSPGIVCSTDGLGATLLTDEDLCALEYAVETLRAIAKRYQQVGEVLEPVNNIRVASARAKIALRRLEPVVRKIDGL